MMGATTGALAVAALLVLLAMVLLYRPLRGLIRLLLRSSVGLAVLAVLNQVGLGLGVNVINALILGILGVPGFGLLLMLQWALR